MRPLCLALLLALCLPGCSRFTASGRMDRAYYKQLKQVKVAREKRRKNLIAHQRAQMPKPDDNNPPPLQMKAVQTAPESQ